MENASEVETNPAPAEAPETPSTPTTEAPVQSGADTDKPKDRNEFIRQQVDAKRAEEAGKDAKVQRRAPEGQFKRGPGRPSKAELAARAAATQKPAETPAAPAQKPSVEAKPDVQPAAAPQSVNVPTGLKAAFKATFGTLSKEWQEEIARLDKTAQDAAGAVGAKYAPDAKFAQEIRGEIQPYEMMIRAEGGTPQTAVRALLQDAALFRFGTPQQKQQRLVQIAKTYNVPLPAAGAQPDAPAEAVLPDITQHPAYQQLMGSVQQLQQGFTQQTQAQQQAQETANLEAVNSFLAETDAKGNAKNPLDDSLQAPFAQEISLVRQLNPSWDARRTLEKAYENLSWKVPELRAVILQKQEAEKQAKQAADLAAKRAAAVQVRGSPASPASNTKPQSRREFIAEQLAASGR